MGSCSQVKGKMKQEIDRWIESETQVVQTLHQSVVVNKVLSQKAKLSIYQRSNPHLW